MSTPFWNRTLREARPLNILKYLNSEAFLGRAHYVLEGYTARTPKWRQLAHLSTLVFAHNLYENGYKHKYAVSKEFH